MKYTKEQRLDKGGGPLAQAFVSSVPLIIFNFQFFVIVSSFC